MAGSYMHITGENGELLSGDGWHIENLDDAYEMCEHMYGMIQYLAWVAARKNLDEAKRLVEEASKSYIAGLMIAPQGNHD